MESTWEGFTTQIDAGFGLEFDVQPTADGGFAISHDQSLTRLTGGGSAIELNTVPTNEISAIQVPGGRLCTLDELLEYMAERATAISALHLKASSQTKETLKRLISQIEPFESRIANKLIIFDVKIETAKTLREKLPRIQLAASVSDPYDIERYGGATGDTLLTKEAALANRNLYSWVWLDEWDCVGKSEKRKVLVGEETVKVFINAGFKVGVVSPELHATSPSLLGGEAHEDGQCAIRLRKRWAEWSELALDALCTDHATWLKTE